MKSPERIVICIVLLVIAYAACGCKEEHADSKELIHAQEVEIVESGVYIDIPKGRTPEPNEAIFCFDYLGETVTFIYDGKNKIVKCNKEPKEAAILMYKTVCEAFQGASNIEYDFPIRFPEPNCQTYVPITEPNDIKIDYKKHYTASELDEIYKDNPSLGRLAKDLHGVGEGKLLWKTDGQGQAYIPTWPECIELGKDLIIVEPKVKVPPLTRFSDEYGNEITEYKPKTVYPKGTKIYFKE